MNDEQNEQRNGTLSEPIPRLSSDRNRKISRAQLLPLQTQRDIIQAYAAGEKLESIVDRTGKSRRTVLTEIKSAISLMRNSIIDSAGDLVAMEWAKLDRREARVWALIDEWEKREREAGPNLLIAQHTKGGGSEGTWESESKPVVMAKRDVLQGASIVALYSQLDKITHTRMQLLKLMEPAEDKSVDTTMMIVVVNDRQSIKPIMDATSFQRIISTPQLSHEEFAK